MASFNRVIIMGNLTAEIDLRSTPGGTSVADVSLAINDRRKNQAGDWVEDTTFVDVTLWGRTAEVACAADNYSDLTGEVEEGFDLFHRSLVFGV